MAIYKVVRAQDVIRILILRDGEWQVWRELGPTDLVWTRPMSRPATARSVGDDLLLYALGRVDEESR